jgi:filamentous hemagglutinin
VQVPSGFSAYDLNGNPLLDAAGNPVTTLPLNSQGQAIIEMKTGGGQLTSGQTTVYPAAQTGNAAGVGGAGNASNAGKINMNGPISPTPVYVLKPR